jgi:hypothetical protein
MALHLARSLETTRLPACSCNYHQLSAKKIYSTLFPENSCVHIE